MPTLQQLIGPVAVTGLQFLSATRRPTYQGRLQLQGLTAPVEIIRDRWGVPHIYAHNAVDLVFAQGFSQAQDRLWQMDYQRRVVAGRLAEILGETALSADQGMRILGLRRVAETELTLLEGNALCAELEAFAAGVNACMQTQPLPVEFALLRYQPEPWNPADSLSWAKMISWGLSINWETELLREAVIDRLGPEIAAAFELPWRASWPIITPSAVHGAVPQSSGIRPTRLEQAPGITAALQDAAPDQRRFSPLASSAGSNNWVVAGSCTASGKPLLANDMHLPLMAPAIWYENHLIAEQDGLNVTGVSFPGVPYVVSGHNGYVAWGFTNGYPDVQDLFIERLRSAAEGEIEYEFRGQWRPAEVRQEIIHIKGAPSVVQEVIVTHHGPIINVLAPGLASPPGPDGIPERPLALRWTSLDPDTMVDAIRSLNRARSCMEVRDALREWAAPIQNVVYADTRGDIGYSYPGRVPIRPRSDGRTPVPGWTGEHEWQGYVPFDELPHQFNPTSGYIVSANNLPVADDYPHFIGTEFSMGDRAQRIVDLIVGGDMLDPAYFQQMHFDQYAVSLHRAAQVLSGLKVQNAELAALIPLLRDWDGHLTSDSPAGAVCETFIRLLGWVLLEAGIGAAEDNPDAPSLVERLMGAGPTPLVQETTFFGHRITEWLLALIETNASPWFDLGHGETREDVLRIVLHGVSDYLTQRLGPPDPAFHSWSWGRLHTITFGHVIGAAPALAPFFDRGPFPVGGDGNTVWATGGGFMPSDSRKVIGPPFRFIADLSDLSRSQGLLAPGNSGRADSEHYDDQVSAWFEGRYHPMLFARKDVEGGAKARLELVALEEREL